MAILDTEKIDFLWKRIIYGVTKTAAAATKFGSNETIPSPLPVLPSAIWADAASIPVTPPVSTAAPVTVFTGAQRIRLTNDATAPANQSWIACSTYSVVSTRYTDFIPPTLGVGYAIKAWIGDPNGGPAARIFPDTTNEEWVFDYASGVLNFVANIPANKTATVGSGTVSVSTNGVYIEVYRYSGTKGLPSPGAGALSQLTDVEIGTGINNGAVLVWQNGLWVPELLGSMAFQNSGAIAVTGGSLANVTLSNVTIDGGTF